VGDPHAHADQRPAESLPHPQARRGASPPGGGGDVVPLVLLGQLLHLSWIDH
jgi:hypothetical protein